MGFNSGFKGLKDAVTSDLYVLSGRYE